LAGDAVRSSDARILIERGALGAAHGGRIEDWNALVAWFDPATGRAERFAQRLVRALPGMHVNLRRLHSSAGTATTRARALTLAKACANPALGSALWAAAVGDHPWRKLYGQADEHEGGRIRSWREGPHVGVPGLLRATGRTGARGRAPAARDDTAAREQVRRDREQRRAEHSAAIREILAAGVGARISQGAARVALASLLAAVRALASDGRRTGARDGLACTLFHVGTLTGTLQAPTWRILTPGRIPVFHLPNKRAELPLHLAPIEDKAVVARVVVAGAR
jgi:hypothetical protein